MYMNLNMNDHKKQAKMQKNHEKASNLSDLTQYYKQKSLKIAQIYTELGDYKRAEKMINCGNYLVFYECPAHCERFLKHGFFCKQRFCPACASRRSRIFKRDTIKILDYILERNKNQQFIFATVTQENVHGAELPGHITAVLAGWSKLRRRRQFDRAFKGWIRALEITHNADRNDYHVHIHMILQTSPGYFNGADYISHERLMTMWQESMTLDYEPNVDIRAIYSKDGERAEEKAVKETMKYVMTFSNIRDGEVLQDLTTALKKRQCIAYGGELAKIKRILKIQDVESDKVDFSDDPHGRKCTHCDTNYKVIMERWDYGANKYVATELTD